VLHAAQLVQQVEQRQDRVTPGHARPGEPHDLARLLALGRLVAMDGTLGAGRFSFAVRALGEATFRVAHEFGASAAQLRVRVTRVMLFAVNAGHADQRLVFPRQAAFQRIHDVRIAVFLIHLFDAGQSDAGQPLAWNHLLCFRSV
jgi:hypothetical protein